MEMFSLFSELNQLKKFQNRQEKKEKVNIDANRQQQTPQEQQDAQAELNKHFTEARNKLNQMGKNPIPKGDVDDGLYNASMFEEGDKTEEEFSDKAVNGDTPQQKKYAHLLRGLAQEAKATNSKMMPPTTNADGAGPSGIDKTDENAKTAASAFQNSETPRTAHEQSSASRQSPAAQPSPHTTPPPNTPRHPPPPSRK